VSDDQPVEPPPDDDPRVEDLLARMTLPEKLAQLGCVWSTQLFADDDFSAAAAADLMPDGTGQVTRIAASTGLRPEGLARMANHIQHWLVTETRLGIPAIIHEESTAGFCARDAVQFPQAIGLASSWNRELLEAVATHIRSEMVAVGARQSLAPVLDIARDPRWGRVEETYGEDPVLVGELGAAYVRGLQATNADDASGLADAVIATGKHFLGYGSADGGLNHGPVQLGPRELREVFAEPFAAAIRDAGLASVMNSYSSVDGLPCAGSRLILTELLRGELGFVGTVVADYFAVDLLRTHHRIAPNKAVAGAKALLAGLDVELPATDCFAELPGLVAAGVIPEEFVDVAVRRVLHHKYALGLFDFPYVEETGAAAAFGTPQGRELARLAALESVVLLDNDGVLPIRVMATGRDDVVVRRIAVIGPAADDPRLCEGDYHYPAHLEIIYGETTPASDLLPASGGAFAPGPYFPDIVTPLAGLRSTLLGHDVELVHARGCDITGSDRSGIDAAVQLADDADVVVVCLGGRSGLTPDATVGEARDATDLDLTGVQLELLDAVAATGTPVVTVIVSGRVHTLDVVEERSNATLLAWVPGIEGGTAIAQVLLGEVAPSGRLPVSLPRAVGQVPVHYNHRAGGGRSQFWGDYTDSPSGPLHPFGFGLSTTTFTYSDLDITAGSTTETSVITARLRNDGPVDADEVVQCYVHDETASVARPERQLVGFGRVHLPVGASATITFEVHPSRLAFYDEDFQCVCEPGAFRFEVGGWAGAPALVDTVDLAGDVTHHRQRDWVSTTFHSSIDG
jgi:beta-glucosidase